MKGRNRIENPELIEFLKPNIESEIKPDFGLRGFNFNQNIKDFEQIWTYSFFEKELKNDLNFEIDEKYFFVNISTNNKAIELDIDLFTGKISSISCRKGYKGLLNNGIGIGSSIKEALKIDNRLGFNPDTDWIDRTPFDGLIIYVPHNLQMKYMDNLVSGAEIPDFEIEQIEIVNIEYAKKFYGDGELIFK